MEESKLKQNGDHSLQLFTKTRIIKNLTCISTSFLLLFMSYDGLAMLQSSMNNEHGVGVFSQAAVYVGFALGALMLPKYVIKKLGCKTTIALGAIMFMPYEASNLYPQFYIMLPTAVFLGIGSSLLWGAQCTYFNESCFLFWKLVNGNENPPVSHTVTTSVATITSMQDIKVQGSAENCSSSVIGTNSRQHFMNYENNTSHNISIVQNLKENETMTEKPKSEDFSDTYLNPQVKRTSYGSVKDVQSIKSLSTKNTSSRESINAIFFGLHGFLYMSAMCFSNLMSYLILDHDHSNNNITINTNCLCGSQYCSNVACLSNNTMQETAGGLRSMLTFSSLVLALLAVTVVCFCVDQLGAREPNTQFSLGILLATLKRAKKKEQVFLIPMSFFVGLEQGFYIGDFTRSFIACSLGTHKIGLVTVTYGITAVLASSLGGLMVKFIGRIPVFITGIIIVIATSTTLLEWDPNPEELYVFFICSSLFGIITGIFISQTVAFYGVLFSDDQEAAFAFHYLCTSVGYAVAFGYNDYLCSYVKIYILIAVGILGIIGFLICERSFYLRKMARK